MIALKKPLLDQLRVTASRMYLAQSQRQFSSPSPNNQDPHNKDSGSATSLYSKIDPYLRLIRFQRQIGTQLLLLPCYWGLLIGSPTLLPSLSLFSYFTLGAFSCRSAGCIINDYLDRDIDKFVERSSTRPLTTGEIPLLNASLFFTSLMALNFYILFSLPPASILSGLLITPVVFAYPLFKRFFMAPQLILGVAFNSGVIIGAVAGGLPLSAGVVVPFYVGGILWTMVYDTIYAYQDVEFDKKLGLQSAAITFYDQHKLILSTLSFLSLGCFTLGGFNFGLAWPFYLGMTGVGAHYCWQMATLDIKNHPHCQRLFVANKYLGLMVALSILAGKYYKQP